jgi:hypothetical protein
MNSLYEDYRYFLFSSFSCPWIRIPSQNPNPLNCVRIKNKPDPIWKQIESGNRSNLETDRIWKQIESGNRSNLETDRIWKQIESGNRSNLETDPDPKP